VVCVWCGVCVGGLCGICMCVCGVCTHLLSEGKQLVRLKWVKGRPEGGILYEKWNAHSRITVTKHPGKLALSSDPGLSPKFQGSFHSRRLRAKIDAAASTNLIEFDGDLKKLKPLQNHIRALVHYLRPNARVLVIGVGGGVDVLTALSFHQESILGIELNRALFEVLTEEYGDFTGNLHKLENVQLVNDEARSYIASHGDTYDIIQVSLIDTWAATAAGAFALSENALYTVEAWKLFLQHLRPKGILTFGRWHFDKYPGEMYRMVSLASQALHELGVTAPQDHMLIAYTPTPPRRIAGVGNFLLSRDPFSDEDVYRFTQVSDQQGYKVALTPTFSSDRTYTALTSSKEAKDFIRNHRFDLSPSTDDRPFFFNMIRLTDSLASFDLKGGPNEFNLKAVGMLVLLTLISILMSMLCIIIPLRRTANTETIKASYPLLFYFGSIGLGFMFIEIALLQRLLIVLGHPTYSLSVVLFTLLTASGLGSLSTHSVTSETAFSRGKLLLAGLITVLVLCELISSPFTVLLQTFSLEARVCFSAALIAFAGFFMGMAFPIGLKLVRTKAITLMPWLWGINGAASVCASVFAVAITMASGITTTYWVGVACYVLTLLSLMAYESRETEPNS